MAAIDFPDAPTVGQVYDKWTWNGTVWTLTDLVARLLDADADVKFTPTGNLDATAASMTDWIVSSVNVPTWATRARVVTTVAGAYQASGSGSAFQTQTRLGPNSGATNYVSPTSVGSRQTFTWTDGIVVTGTGTIPLTVMAVRSIGDGVLRADTACTCRFTVRFDW